LTTVRGSIKEENEFRRGKPPCPKKIKRKREQLCTERRAGGVKKRRTEGRKRKGKKNRKQRSGGKHCPVQREEGKTTFKVHCEKELGAGSLFCGRKARPNPIREIRRYKGRKGDISMKRRRPKTKEWSGDKISTT